MKIDLNNFQFRSTDHVRYVNGADVSGHQKGNNRLVEIKGLSEIDDIYWVTIYNLDGSHPYWQNNRRMAPKRMHVSKRIESVIELKGLSTDSYDLDYENYGLTIILKNNDVEKVVLHMYDRHIDIEYWR